MNLVSIYISLKNGSLYLTLSYLHFILLITDPMTHCHSLTIKQEMAHIAERIYCSGYYHWRTVTQKTQLDHDRHLITWFTIGNTTLTTQVIPERQSTSSVISANLKPIKLLLVVVNQAIANPLFIYLTGWEDLMWWLTCVRGGYPPLWQRRRWGYACQMRIWASTTCTGRSAGFNFFSFTKSLHLRIPVPWLRV